MTSIKKGVFMRISSFNINKFCGPYSLRGRYYNPRNIDFKTEIKETVQSLLKTNDDIFFVQEFIDNQFINVKELFPEKNYKISNLYPTVKSNVVAISLKDSSWIVKEKDPNINFKNKYIEIELVKFGSVKCRIFSFHNTDEVIKNKVETFFNDPNLNDTLPDIILGDFNNIGWINKIHNLNNNDYRDLVTNDMITYKPAQTAIDRIFVKKKYEDNIVFNGIIETFASDHNLLTFTINH